jgi:hypothetical protein
VARRAGAAAGAAVALGACYALLIRPWQLRWGATSREAAAVMPGDDIVGRPHLQATRAIEIAAGPAEIWPWLAQMGGYTRAGWYSYDHLDNGGRPSARRIIPELQALRVGDVLPTAPDGTGYTVEAVAPRRHLVLAIRHPDVQISLACLLRPVRVERTRLVVRMRLHAAPTPRGVCYLAAMDAGDFVMTHRMLAGIRRRAQAVR